MNDKTKIFITGGNGLVGSRIIELLRPVYQCESISRSEGVDITNKHVVTEKIKNSSASAVLHLAAKANVDLCEQDKELDTDFKNGNISEQEIIRKKTAWAVNVFGTKNIADACVQNNKKLIYISTDFVFNGQDTPEDGYTEENMPSPINWYAQTKYEGEKIIQQMQEIPRTIIRISYPYRAHFPKKEYVRVFLSLLQQGKTFAAITDHLFTPTFIDDIAYALQFILKQNLTGMFHITGSQSLSPYDAAVLVADKFGLPKKLIGPTTRAEFFKDKAPRPFNLTMNNDKIQRLGITMKTFDQGLDEVKNQIKD